MCFIGGKDKFSAPEKYGDTAISKQNNLTKSISAFMEQKLQITLLLLLGLSTVASVLELDSKEYKRNYTKETRSYFNALTSWKHF